MGRKLVSLNRKANVMHRQHTYQASAPALKPTPTRTERRFQRKGIKRHLKKLHRAALHGLPRKESPPSLLQSLRLGMEIQRKQAEIEKQLGS
jgi:hypothetical protein